MFYTYDYTNFPNITIYFSKQLIQDEELDLFLKDWEDLYAKNIPFTLIFDTTAMSSCIPLFRHSFKVINFIKHLKSLPPLLKKSIIIVDNDVIKNTLFFIFQLESPLAPVYITKPLDIKKFLKNLEFSEHWYSDDIIKIVP